MTERGQPAADGSSACPFVAFDDDRDGRADRPDPRHRCFADTEPTPRALAHQEAYCLSSAFPVCPTFQAWARREAAHARRVEEGRPSAPTPTTSPAEPRSASPSLDTPGSAMAAEGAGTAADRAADEPLSDIPIESRPHRNPPRDWAAPPPWATGAGSSIGSGADASEGSGPSSGASAFLTPHSSEGQGLVGSPADRLASGEVIDEAPSPDAMPPPPIDVVAARPRDLPSAGPDPELAGLVSGGGPRRPGLRGELTLSEEERIAAGYPPRTRTGRRPAVSATRGGERERERAPQREHVQGRDGPSWERARRYEAYPAIKTRVGLGGLSGLPRVATLAAALGVAAIALFFLPALLGVGGGKDTGSPNPSTSATIATPSPSPTPEPAPTPQVYVIKPGDTLSKIARANGLTLDQLLEANKDTITNPDRIAVGDQIIIPVPVPDEVSGGSPAVSAAP